MTLPGPPKGTVQDAGHGKSADLLLVLPVVPHGVPGEKDGEICRILRILVAAFGTSAEGMNDAGSLLQSLVFGLIEAGQQKTQKGGVVIEGELAESAVALPQVLAEAAIIAAVQVKLPHPQLRFIDYYISKHTLACRAGRSALSRLPYLMFKNFCSKSFCSNTFYSNAFYSNGSCSIRYCSNGFCPNRHCSRDFLKMIPLQISSAS